MAARAADKTIPNCPSPTNKDEAYPEQGTDKVQIWGHFIKYVAVGRESERPAVQSQRRERLRTGAHQVGTKRRKNVENIMSSKLFTTRQGTILLGVIAAVIAAIALIVYLNNYRNSVNQPPVPVLVAKKTIPQGMSGDVIATSTELLQGGEDPARTRCRAARSPTRPRSPARSR